MNRDSRFERRLGQILTVGSVGSTLLLAAGLAIVLVTRSSAGPGDVTLRAGLIVLMATPMMRVLASTVEYVTRRDWFFVLVTLIVLLELAASVIGALRG